MEQIAKGPTARCVAPMIVLTVGVVLFDGASATRGERSERGPLPVIAADACADAVSIPGTGLFAFRSTDATTDGFDLTGCAEPGTGTGAIENDVWACWTSPCDGMVFVSTCGLTVVDTRVAVYDGCDTCPGTGQTLLACNDDGCATGLLTSRLHFNAVSGQRYLVQVGNFPGQFPGEGEISIECGAPNCPNAAAGSCLSESGLPGCDDESCCDATCFVDPLCCTSAWNSNCAAIAAELCAGFPACNDPGAGDCGSAQPLGPAGCNDMDCCARVCTGDPFCCLETWSDSCAARAASACAINCGPGRGNCMTSNGSAGCDDEPCCEAVCARDPVCCLGGWDAICVSKAATLCSGMDCGGCPFDVNANGTIDTGDFSFFAACFARFVAPGDACFCADVNGNLAVDTGDFAAFAGCFAHGCPCPILPTNALIASRDSSAGVTVRLRITSNRGTGDRAAQPGPSTSTYSGGRFDLEVWAMSDSPLACVFADISFDPNSVRVDGVSHSPRFGTLASHEIDSRSGRIRNVGGCIAPGEEVDDSGWVRVAVVEVKVREPRSPAFGVHPASNRAYGVSLVGGALPLAREEITWRGATPRATDGKGHRHPNK